MAENPTSTPIKTDQDERNAVDPLDFEDVMDMLKRIQSMTIWQGKILSKSDKHSDGYKADIYAVRGTDPNQATYKDILIFEPDINNEYLKGAWVDVILDANMIGIIAPRRIPRGSGRWKALLLIDDSNPGTAEWDYWRFQS